MRRHRNLRRSFGLGDQSTFGTDPLPGSTARTARGRQVGGSEVFLPSFSTAADAFFAFDPDVFHFSSLSFFTGADDAMPGGANVVVPQTSDNEGNAGTPFGAGNAANLIDANRIAAQMTAPGPGFFVYMNNALDLRRPVYSTDLSDPTADLKILARLLDPTGAAAIAMLPSFAADNFVLVEPVAVLPPLSIALLGTAIAIGRAARPVIGPHAIAGTRRGPGRSRAASLAAPSALSVRGGRDDARLAFRPAGLRLSAAAARTSGRRGSTGRSSRARA